MLGVALNAQRAGWSGGLAMTSTTNTAVAAYMSYPNTVSMWSDNAWASPGTNLSPSFDASGVVSGNKINAAYTARLGAESSYTWTQNPYRTDYDYLAPDASALSYDPIFLYLNQPGNSFIPTGNPKIGRRRSDNAVSFLIEWLGYEFVPISGVTWSDLEDTWITVVVGNSDNSSDFANFDPLFNTGSQCCRVALVNTRSGALIGTTDFQYNQFQSADTDWATQTIAYAASDPGSTDSWFNSQFRNVPIGDPVLVASLWSCFGEIIDPTATTDGVPNYQYFCGNYLPEYIAGVRAWVNIGATSFTNDSTNITMFAMQPGRAAESTDRYAKELTSAGTSPYISTIIP